MSLQLLSAVVYRYVAKPHCACDRILGRRSRGELSCSREFTNTDRALQNAAGREGCFVRSGPPTAATRPPTYVGEGQDSR